MLVWALSWCCGNTVDFDQLLRTRSCEWVIVISLRVQATWCTNRAEKSELENHWSDGVCAMACNGCMTHAASPPSIADGDDNGFTSRTDFITPILTEGSTTAFSSFLVVLSFSTSLGKEEKSDSFGYLKPQLCAVSHLEKPARATTVLLQAVASQGQDSSDVRQKELQKPTINESMWHPNQSL